jgi:hypothetical protein
MILCNYQRLIKIVNFKCKHNEGNWANKNTAHNLWYDGASVSRFV